MLNRNKYFLLNKFNHKHTQHLVGMKDWQQESNSKSSIQHIIIEQKIKH